MTTPQFQRWLIDHYAQEDPKNIPDRVRRAVLDRDDWQCQLCGTGGENRLQLHHVQYRSQGGRHYEHNLVTVCKSCHEDIHAGRTAVLLIEIEPGVWATFPATPPRRTRTP